MRGFVQDGLWARLADNGGLHAGHIDDLLALLVPFHAEAAVAATDGPLGSPMQVRAPLLDTLNDLGRMRVGRGEAAALHRLRTWEAASFDRLQPVLARRLAQGRVREGHGVVVLDCYRVHRAMVLAKVSLLRAGQRTVDARAEAGRDHATARRNIALAPQISRADRAHPVLMLTHGFSGSGKSTLTQALLDKVGAIRICADVERMRQAGLSRPTARRHGRPRSDCAPLLDRLAAAGRRAPWDPCRGGR